MSKTILTALSAFLASVIALYVMFANKAPWSVISLYWCVVAWKNWKDAADEIH